jgi:hypothetical protein
LIITFFFFGRKIGSSKLEMEGAVKGVTGEQKKKEVSMLMRAIK